MKYKEIGRITINANQKYDLKPLTLKQIIKLNKLAKRLGLHTKSIKNDT